MIKVNYLKYTFLTVALAVIVSVCLVPKDADAETTIWGMSDDQIEYQVRNDCPANVYTLWFTLPYKIDNYMEFCFDNPVDWQHNKIDPYIWRVEARGPPLFVNDSQPAWLSFETDNPASDNPWYQQDIRNLPTAQASLKMFSMGGTYMGTDYVQVPVPPSPSTEIPTVSEWGMIIFFLLLVGSAVFVMRRKQDETL